MKILIVGGGPAGLFFSILAKRARPDAEVQVCERNPDGVTYGWGVAFTDSAITTLMPSAPDVVERLGNNARHETMEIVLDGHAIPIDVGPSHMNSRWSMLEMLEKAAVAEGVVIRHDCDAELGDDDLGEWDLIVGADGVNSRLRDTYAAHFSPSVQMGRNWLAWYGTPKAFPLSIILQNSEEGVWMAHSGRFSENASNFTIEIGEATFERMGLAAMSDEESRHACQGVFAPYLAGNILQSNHSPWFQTKFVTCAQWTYRNVVLIGDALHTVHPSIGSGTRFAMRDAVYLLQALEEHGWTVPAALRGFESRRKPVAEAFQAAAKRSISWYEGLPERKIENPVKFAIEFIMRTGRVPFAEFRRANRELILAYETDLRC
jgi:anthraniloyl-CoA monooxygenase